MTHWATLFHFKGLFVCFLFGWFWFFVCCFVWLVLVLLLNFILEQERLKEQRGEVWGQEAEWGEDAWYEIYKEEKTKEDFFWNPLTRIMAML